jgi:hypothetical protein
LRLIRYLGKLYRREVPYLLTTLTQCAAADLNT